MASIATISAPRSLSTEDGYFIRPVRALLETSCGEVQAGGDRVVDVPARREEHHVVHLPAPAAEQRVSDRMVVHAAARVVIGDRERARSARHGVDALRLQGAAAPVVDQAPGFDAGRHGGAAARDEHAIASGPGVYLRD